MKTKSKSKSDKKIEKKLLAEVEKIIERTEEYLINSKLEELSRTVAGRELLKKIENDTVTEEEIAIIADEIEKGIKTLCHYTNLFPTWNK